jgi:hypothetical protein
MIRTIFLALVFIAVCLTMREVMDTHCRLSCKDDGELGGYWLEKRNACVCIFLREPALKINGTLPKKEEVEDEKPYRYDNR